MLKIESAHRVESEESDRNDALTFHCGQPGSYFTGFLQLIYGDIAGNGIENAPQLFAGGHRPRESERAVAEQMKLVGRLVKDRKLEVAGGGRLDLDVPEEVSAVRKPIVKIFAAFYRC